MRVSPSIFHHSVLPVFWKKKFEGFCDKFSRICVKIMQFRISLLQKFVKNSELDIISVGNREICLLSKLDRAVLAKMSAIYVMRCQSHVQGFVNDFGILYNISKKIVTSKPIIARPRFCRLWIPHKQPYKFCYNNHFHISNRF